MKHTNYDKLQEYVNQHYYTYMKLPSCYWHPNGRSMNKLAESLDTQTASLLAHDETDSIHEI